VGGDFFQILPGDIPGRVLIVVGDVTGKGLQAGMLVALIVGAIRAAIHHSSDPSQILSEVNQQLCERQQASATCMILRIDPDGSVIIANAGQLPPYLNGRAFRDFVHPGARRFVAPHVRWRRRGAGLARDIVRL
jgi:serine phosphatase RsbU (regulator of sigma subunit)